MRICILTSGHSPFDSRIFYKEVLSLKQKYKDIVIIAPYDNNIEVQGIKIVKINSRKNWWNRFWPMIQLYSKGLYQHADVYHCHEPDSLFIGYLLKRRLRCKLIYDSHEYHPEAFAEHMHSSLSWIVKRIIYFTEKIIAKKADYIITVNDLLVKKFERYQPNVVLIPNYPRLEMFNFKNDNIHKDIDFIYIGELSRSRGSSIIIEASRILKKRNMNFNICFIGGFSSLEYESEIKSLIDRYKLQEQVNFIEWIEHSKVNSILRRAKVGLVILQPNVYRYTVCEPIKLFEYMGNGLPVIANNYDMVRNIILPSECGILVDPTNPNEIADAMEEILKNQEKWIKRGKKGMLSVKEKFNWKIYGEKLTKIYMELNNNN